MAAAIEVTGLRKAYAGREALRDVSFTVERGEIFALLGPNGAGKTTTVEILEGYRRADGGTVRVLGQDPARAGTAFRARIGIVLQGSGVYPFMTPREALELFAGYYPRPRSVDETLAAVGLEERADALVRTLSGGQVRRLDVALALIGNPELIFLDEPTTGFDPGARRSAWDAVAALAAGGTTVFLTTHYMDEAQALADRVAVLRDGAIVAMGEPRSLAPGAGRAVEIRVELPAHLDAEVAELLGTRPTRTAGRLTVITPDPTRALHALTGWALERGVPLERLEVQRPSLEDVFLALTAEAAPVLAE
jgi:ABC-2 type transport system ATP-binding protein